MSTGGLLVLVVDDDAAHRKIVQRQLETNGHEVLAASCPKEAALILEGSARRPDVILMDVVMGQESGLTAISGLAAIGKAPIVIMSGNFDEEMRRDALLIGAKATVGKPMDFKALDSLLRSLAAGS